MWNSEITDQLPIHYMYIHEYMYKGTLHPLRKVEFHSVRTHSTIVTTQVRNIWFQWIKCPYVALSEPYHMVWTCTCVFRSNRLIQIAAYMSLASGAVMLVIVHTLYPLTVSWPSCCRPHRPDVGDSWQHWKRGWGPQSSENPRHHWGSALYPSMRGELAEHPHLSDPVTHLWRQRYADIMWI